MGYNDPSIKIIRMNPKNANYWNEIANTWQHTNQQKLLRLISDTLNDRLFDNWLAPKKVNRLLKTDLFDESLTDGLYPLLSKRAKSVVGIDISAATINAAKQHHKQLQAVIADVRHLPYASGTFDIIVSNSTLDHFQTSAEIITSLKELKRVLRKDGQLLITLDNITNPIIALRHILPFKLLNRLGIVPYYVGATFGARRLKSTLEELNFSVLEVTTFWHFPRIFLVPIATVVDKYFSDKFRRKFLNMILAFEYLSKLPTKYITGQFVAAKAIKRS